VVILRIGGRWVLEKLVPMYALPIALLLYVALPLPNIVLVSIQGERKIGIRVSFAVRESGLISVAMQVSSQFEPYSSQRIVIAKSPTPLSYLG
jgi:hypothetical protein